MATPPKSTNSHADHHQCDDVCALCGSHKPFDFPQSLYEAFLARRAIVFAGAGVSTESRKVYPHPLLDEVLHQVDPTETSRFTFPQAMSELVNRHGRAHLLRMIQRRFDYVEGFPELEMLATEFHHELGTIHVIKEVVTTNWDEYFERFAACIPFVVPADYTFWELPGRKVFKIHGSVSNIGSIVATTDDYEECANNLNTGVIGATLKHLLATKVVVFVGYSLQDEDFRLIYKFMRSELGFAMPKAYLVTPYESSPDQHELGLELIQTDGVFFLRELKRRLVEDRVMLPDSVYEACDAQHSRVAQAHDTLMDKLRPDKYPPVVFAAAYQDGLLHAFGRISAHQKKGDYSDPHYVLHRLHDYERLRKDHSRQRSYWDAAYTQGYFNALLFLALSAEGNPPRLPLYFAFGADGDVHSVSALRRALASSPPIHKSALKSARRIVRSLGSSDLVPHHTPFL